MFKILIPDENHDTINDVDLSSLRKKGLNNILIDVDNTIVPWNSDKVSSNLRTWIKSLRIQDSNFTYFPTTVIQESRN